MNLLMIVLRIIHIFSGVFWVGFAFFNIGFLQPTVRATGAEGQAVMRHLAQRTRLLNTVYATATLTMLSGMLMYWALFSFNWAFLSSGYGLVLTIGSIAGIIAWVYALFTIRGIFRDMGVIGQAIQAQGGPPTAEQAGALQALGARLSKAGHIALGFLIVALVGMAAAPYIWF